MFKQKFTVSFFFIGPKQDHSGGLWKEEIFKKFLTPPPNQLYHCLKFPEEPYVILKIVAQILNLPLEHCNSLHTHTKCKA